MRKSTLILLFCLMLTGCGYQIQGRTVPNALSFLGDGTVTVAVESVDQATMYTWVPYYVRLVTRDEMILRKLAVWNDGVEADYLIRIRVPAFRVAAFDSNADRPADISSVAATVEFTFIDSKTGNIAWQSGQISYSENFENPREESAIKDVLAKAIGKVFDNIQMAF